MMFDDGVAQKSLPRKIPDSPHEIPSNTLQSHVFGRRDGLNDNGSFGT